MYIQEEPRFTLVIYSHFFKVLNPKESIIKLLINFCSKYTVINKGRNSEDNDTYKVFASKRRNGEEWRFHIGQLEEFEKMLKAHSIDQYLVRKEEMFEPTKIDVDIKPGWVARDYQIEINDFILEDAADDNRSRLVGLQTGKGKSFIALNAVANIKNRAAIIILPTYIEKWVGDITKTTTVEEKEVMVVKGSSRLKGLIGMAKDDNLSSKFIVMSMVTLRNFYKDTEELHPDEILDMYGCYPEDLFRTLGIGTVIIDEVHQHLHAVYRFCINLHVPRLVALSATFVSDDPTIKKVQHMMFPKEIRFDKLAFDKYIRTFAICYNFKKMYGIRTSEYGSNTYSHMAFELSIIRNRDLLRSYMEMIYYVVKVGYLKDMDGRDKLIIFAARIEMCTKIVEFLRAKHPELDIRRYCEDDPYENIIDSQICVSTIQSGGTAIDIPELRVAIMTTNVSGPIPNLQALGRLRKLPDRDVKFYYLFCEQIPKQVNYHRTKKELFQDKVASIKEFKHPYQV